MDLDKTIQIYMRDLLMAGGSIHFKDLDLRIDYNDETHRFEVIDYLGEIIVSYVRYASAENYVLSMQ